MRNIVLFSIVIFLAACTGPNKNNEEDKNTAHQNGKFYGLKEINASDAISSD